MTFLEQMNAELVRLQKRQAILLDLITAYGEPYSAPNVRLKLHYDKYGPTERYVWVFVDTGEYWNAGNYVLTEDEIYKFARETGNELTEFWNGNRIVNSMILAITEWKNKQL